MQGRDRIIIIYSILLCLKSDRGFVLFFMVAGKKYEWLVEFKIHQPLWLVEEKKNSNTGGSAWLICI